ncbi:hypothetical protein FRB99_005314 [Tulasnella sp. 403]|nr:hypothetical protein FRB99_005314 [Tulasnella sp. 403]
MSSFLESYSYPHFGPDLQHVYIGYLRNIRNAESIRSRIIKAAAAPADVVGDCEREAVNFAFIDAKTITSRQHILAAVHVALIAASNSDLTTKTFHSEILWALNNSNNITESIKRFGVSESSTTLIVVRIGNATPSEDESALRSTEAVVKLIEEVVEGEWTSLDALPETTDWSLVQKYYKMQTDPILAKFQQKGNTTLSPDSEAMRNKIINEIAISAVAMKSVLA